MTDREKVIKDMEQFRADLKPFCGNYADWERFDAGLSLLKEQEEQIKNRDESLEKAREEIKWLRGMLKEQSVRVMTMDELAEIYVEFKGDDCPIRSTNFDLQKIIMYMVEGDCRLWTGRPTDEQRKAVKWDD